MNTVKLKTTILISSVLGIALVALAAIILLGITDDKNNIERELFATGMPAEYVTFNSITDNPTHGDERNFSQIRKADAGNDTYSDTISLEEGEEYVVYIYYDNNADESKKMMSNGAYVKSVLPGFIKAKTGSASIYSYIGAHNSNPLEVMDNVILTNETSKNMMLSFVPGSATIHNFGKTNGATMADTITSKGALLGFDSLDGKLPGGNRFAGYVTYRFVVGQPAFEITASLRKSGTKEWKENLKVSAGDKFDILVTFSAKGTVSLKDVIANLKLPDGLQYVDDTTWVVNSTSPKGVRVGNSIATKDGINISSYSPGSKAYIRATLLVTDSAKDTINIVASVITKYGTKLVTIPIKVEGR